MTKAKFAGTFFIFISIYAFSYAQRNTFIDLLRIDTNYTAIKKLNMINNKVICVEINDEEILKKKFIPNKYNEKSLLKTISSQFGSIGYGYTKNKNIFLKSSNPIDDPDIDFMGDTMRSLKDLTKVSQALDILSKNNIPLKSNMSLFDQEAKQGLKNLMHGSDLLRNGSSLYDNPKAVIEITGSKYISVFFPDGTSVSGKVNNEK